jgi:hypothetical protein
MIKFYIYIYIYIYQLGVNTINNRKSSKTHKKKKLDQNEHKEKLCIPKCRPSPI